MKIAQSCNWSGCENEAGPAHFIHGNAYCPNHYYPALEKHFREEFQAWDGVGVPTKKFLNIFSRYVEHIYNERDEGMPENLNTRRLKDDIFDFKKTRNCMEFSINRHPYARSDPSRMKEVKQRWRFNIKLKNFRLLKSSECK